MGKPQPHISNVPTSTRSPPAPPLPSNAIKTGPCFPTWCWEHLRVRFLQQLHGELRVVSAQLEDKATKRKAQCPRRGGVSQGRFLLRGRREPIPEEPWGSPRPPGLVRCRDPWELHSAWKDLPFLSGVQAQSACSYLLGGRRGKAGPPFRETHGPQQGVDLLLRTRRLFRRKGGCKVVGSWRKEVRMLLGLVPARLCRSVHSRAVINRDGDVKLGLVSSARKGNSRDY